MLDRFIPKQYKNNVILHYRAKVLVSLLLLNTFFWFFWFAVTVFAYAIPYQNFTYPIFTALIVGFHFYLLHRFHRYSNYFLAAFFGIFPIILSAVWNGYMSGTAGGITPLLFFFIMVVIFYVLLPLRMAIGLTLLLGSLHTGYALLPYLGVEVTSRFAAEAEGPEIRSLFAAIVVGIVYIALMIMLGIFRAMNKQLSEQLIADNQKLEKISNQDPLTKLANRRFFQSYLNNIIYKASFSETPFSIVFIDLDGFKQINDHYGHHVGDATIVTVAKRIGNTVRAADMVARLGGDEFAIILDGTGFDYVDSICEKIQSAINEPILVDGEKLQVGASIGIAIYPDHTEDLSTLLKKADTAMYEAKSKGGGISFAT